MGLDTSHDAFHGAYSSFNRFRQMVAKAMGGSYPPHDDPEKEAESWYWGDGYTAETHPGLFTFLLQSDCDGDLSPEECANIAKDLSALLPAIAELDDGGAGHIKHAGGYVAVTQRFIDGCQLAADADERLDFH